MTKRFNFDSKTFGETPETTGHRIEVEISISCGDRDGCDAEAEFESIFDCVAQVEREYDSFNDADRRVIDSMIEELCYEHGYEAYEEAAIDRADAILDAYKDGTYE